MVKKTRQLYLTVFIILLSMAFTGATGAAILADETSSVDDTSSDQPIETVWIQRFSDDFDGTEIDATKWNANISTSGERWCSSTIEYHYNNSGNWIDVQNNPCNGFQTTSYGTITVNGGISSFSAGYNRVFPYIWSGEPSRQSPFPDTGDFILNVRMKYDSLLPNGNGFQALSWSDTEPIGDNPYGGQQFVFYVWGDSGGGNRVISPAGQVSISNYLAFHDYRLEYIDGKYSMFIDGVLNAGPVASNLRPNTIWIGNAVFTHWGIGDWSDFSIDSVSVSVPDVSPIAVTNGPYVGNEGSAIILDGSASYDPDTGDSIVSYEWDLDNDGIFDANGMTISNIWADDYSGIVVLKVTDSYGISNTATTTVTVNNVAPTVEAITAPIDPVVVGTTITTSADYDDVGILDTHIAVWDWNDGTPDSGAVDESAGTVTGSHTYNASGIYTVKLTIMDDDGGKVSTEYRYVVVYSPDGEFVTGGGWIDSPAGAYTLDTSMTGKANFGFVSKYKNGATVPTGATEFQLKLADFNFHSKNYEWLVIDDAHAIYKGTGTINGEGDYGFMLTGIDGAVNGDGADKFRIEVWDKATDVIIYDNLLDGANDADLPAINGGNIVIHKN